MKTEYLKIFANLPIFYQKIQINSWLKAQCLILLNTFSFLIYTKCIWQKYWHFFITTKFKFEYFEYFFWFCIRSFFLRIEMLYNASLSAPGQLAYGLRRRTFRNTSPPAKSKMADGVLKYVKQKDPPVNFR